MPAKFPFGRLLITPRALQALSNEAVGEALGRHASGDWGDLCPEDIRANEHALKVGARLLSAYRDGETKFWIITEADRSATTVLLPSEY